MNLRRRDKSNPRASFAGAGIDSFERRLTILNTLLVHAPVGIAFLDPSLRYLRINDAFAPVHGLTPGDHVGHSLPELNPDLSQELQGTFAAVLAGETTAQRTVTRDDVDGERVWQVSYFPVRVETAVAGIGCIAVDVANLTEAERALEIRNCLYSMLSRVNSAVNRCRSPDQLFNETCSIALEAGRFSFAWIGVPRGNEVVMSSSAGVDNGYISSLKISLDPSNDLAKGPTGQAFLKGTHFVINDALASPMTEHWHDVYQQVDFAASASFPIRQGGQVVAVCSLYSKMPGFFSAESVATLDEIMLVVGGALDRLALEDEHAKSFRELQMHDRALNAISQGIVITDALNANNPIVYASASFSRLTGYDHDELIGQNTRLLQGPDSSPLAVESMRHAVRNHQDCVVEVLNYRKDGSTFWNQVAISPVRNESGDVVNFIGVQTDVSERRELERQLMHSQKMESLGVMASGIAHDVNNVLLVIRGYSAVLAHRTTDAETRDVVEQIDSAVQHAADFTRQLLSLTKGQIVHSQISDLNEVVRETLKILEHMIGTDVVIEAKLAEGSLWVDVDRGLVEQAVLNLVANARDAMPSGGVLGVETASVELGDRYSEMYSNVKPGRYIMLQVADSGEGMDENTQNHAFDPFFTTKPRGTGLGLSTVYGVVTQNGGHLRLHSEPGKGAVFKLYFPAMLDEAVSRETPRAGRDTAGAATLLVVENNDNLRHRLMDELVHSGFVVIDAVSGADARRLLADSRATIDLAVVDVDNGSVDEFDLIGEILAENPATRVVVITTRHLDASLRDRFDTSRSAVVHKPLDVDHVATVVHEMLREVPAGSSSTSEAANSLSRGGFS